MRSVAPVCVCVRAVDEAGGGGARALGGARRGASLCGWRCLQPQGRPRGRFSVNLPVRGRGPPRTRQGGVGWLFFGAPPVTRRIPHTAHTLPPHGAPSWRHERAGARRWAAVAPSSSRRPREGRAASHPTTPCPSSSTPRMPSSDRRPTAKRPRSTLCAVPGAAAPSTTTTEADPPRTSRPRRTATREAAYVDATTSGGASLARPRGACSTPCATPSAATNASQTSRSEPLDALSLAQREASVVPTHPRPPAERTSPARAPRSAAEIPPIQTLYRWALF